MYNVKSRYAPKISSELFNQREIRPTISEDFLGLEYLWPELTIMGVISVSKDMGILPALFKEAVSLNSFKKLIKKWVSQACPFRLCQNCISGVGFSESLP